MEGPQNLHLDSPPVWSFKCKENHRKMKEIDGHGCRAQNKVANLELRFDPRMELNM